MLILSLLPNLGKDSGFLCRGWKTTQLHLFTFNRKQGQEMAAESLEEFKHTLLSVTAHLPCHLAIVAKFSLRDTPHGGSVKNSPKRFH